MFYCPHIVEYVLTWKSWLRLLTLLRSTRVYLNPFIKPSTFYTKGFVFFISPFYTYWTGHPTPTHFSSLDRIFVTTNWSISSVTFPVSSFPSVVVAYTGPSRCTLLSVCDLCSVFHTEKTGPVRLITQKLYGEMYSIWILFYTKVSYIKRLLLSPPSGRGV